jgi:cysteine desulfurase
VVASSIEHPSVLAWSQETISVDSRGVIDLEAVERRLKQGSILLSVMAANNETGVCQPVDELYALCQKYGSQFHCDATQIPGRMEVAIQADWISLSAHKFGGPRGIGALIAADPPEPMLRGGSQERGQRAGTLNSPGIIGAGVAAAEASTIAPGERDKLEDFCRKHGAIIVGEGAPRLPNTLSVLFDVPGDLLVTGLDLAGVQASTGSACSSGASSTSHVLQAMGLDGTPVRFSLGRDSEVDHVIDVLKTLLDQVGDVCGL